MLFRSLLVPVWGISAAGGVWAATLLVAAGLPAWQAWRGLHLPPWSSALALVVGLALGTVGIVAGLTRLTLGETTAGLLVTLLVGGGAYLIAAGRSRHAIHVGVFLSGLRGAGSAPGPGARVPEER